MVTGTTEDAGHAPLDMHEIANQVNFWVGRLTSRLLATVASSPVHQTVEDSAHNRGALVAEARRLYQVRRQRGDILSDCADLFGEPAWDMLLDLYVRESQGKTTSVSSLCLAAGVPATTALRCIAELERRELIVRYFDPTDRRRKFLRLSSEMCLRMAALLTQSLAAASCADIDWGRTPGHARMGSSGNG